MVEKLERQLIKYKEKLYYKYNNEYNKIKEANITEKEKSDIIAKADDKDIKIVKTKKFVLKPMSQKRPVYRWNF